MDDPAPSSCKIASFSPWMLACRDVCLPKDRVLPFLCPDVKDGLRSHCHHRILARFKKERWSLVDPHLSRTTSIMGRRSRTASKQARRVFSTSTPSPSPARQQVPAQQPPSTAERQPGLFAQMFSVAAGVVVGSTIGQSISHGISVSHARALPLLVSCPGFDNPHCVPALGITVLTAISSLT
jgi:hypothetical protein